MLQIHIPEQPIHTFTRQITESFVYHCCYCYCWLSSVGLFSVGNVRSPYFMCVCVLIFSFHALKICLPLGTLAMHKIYFDKGRMESFLR